MKKLIVSMNLTLDGFMSGPSSELEWHFQSWTDEMAESLAEELSGSDSILMGRITYQAMEKFWTSRPTNQTSSHQDILFIYLINQYHKIVFSRTLKKVGWNNSELVSGDLNDEVIKLKGRPGKNIMLYGSGQLANSLIKLNLVDEYQLWIHPTLLGKGKPLFSGLSGPMKMTLSKSKTFSSGVV